MILPALIWLEKESKYDMAGGRSGIVHTAARCSSTNVCNSIITRSFVKKNVYNGNAL